MIRRSHTNLGKYLAGDRHVAVLPDTYRKEDAGNKELVIWIPGHNAEATQGITPTYCDRMNFALAAAGYPVLCIDAGYPGGQKSWGNATAMSAIQAAITWGQSAGGLGAKPGKVILSGVSMGGLNSLVFALLNPTLVKGVAVYIPAVSFIDLYAANASGYEQTEMNAAYGVANQAGLVAAAQNREPISNPSGYAGIPIHIWGSDNDGLLTAKQNQFVAAVPSAARTSLGNVGHDPTPTDPAQVVSFVAGL